MLALACCIREQLETWLLHSPSFSLPTHEKTAKTDSSAWALPSLLRHKDGIPGSRLWHVSNLSAEATYQGVGGLGCEPVDCRCLCHFVFQIKYKKKNWEVRWLNRLTFCLAALACNMSTSVCRGYSAFHLAPFPSSWTLASLWETSSCLKL